MEALHFQFGTAGNVPADRRYQPGGFGFITEAERAAQPDEQQFELSTGWATPYWYRDEPLTVIAGDAAGCWLDSDAAVAALWARDGAAPAGKRLVPLSFKADLPAAGNYRVTVELTARRDEDCLQIFCGCRHLMWKGALHKGEALHRTFTVSVAAIIPNGTGKLAERNYLSLSVVGHAPALTAVTVEPVTCPTLYLTGDSTMADYAADYPYNPAACYGGWGQVLEPYLDGSIAVCNQAHNGRTTETLCTEGHYALIMERIRPGDYFLIEFGHNDQKHAHLQAYNGYPANLNRFITEIRAKGAYPLLATPIARNTWLEKDGAPAYNDMLYDHSQACFAVGRERGVPVLDIHERAMADIERLGQDASSIYYHADDRTHTNDYGALRAAGYAARALKKICADFPDYKLLADAVAVTEYPWPPVAAPLLEKPARLADIQDPHAAENEASEHQAEKDPVAKLMETVAAAQKAAQGV